MLECTSCMHEFRFFPSVWLITEMWECWARILKWLKDSCEGYFMCLQRVRIMPRKWKSGLKQMPRSWTNEIIISILRNISNWAWIYENIMACAMHFITISQSIYCRSTTHSLVPANYLWRNETFGKSNDLRYQTLFKLKLQHKKIIITLMNKITE